MVSRYNLLFGRQMAHLAMLNDLCDPYDRFEISAQQQIRRYLKNIDLQNITMLADMDPRHFSTLSDAMKAVNEKAEHAARVGISTSQQQFKQDHNGNISEMLFKHYQNATSGISSTTEKKNGQSAVISALGTSETALFGPSRVPKPNVIPNYA